LDAQERWELDKCSLKNLVISALPELGYRLAMPQLFLMVIVAVAVHLILGWPLLAGIVIVAVILTVPGLIKLFAQVNDENRPAVFGIALQAVGGTIIAAVLAYVPMVLFYYFTGHATW
jgi:hypothetical protein